MEETSAPNGLSHEGTNAKPDNSRSKRGQPEVDRDDEEEERKKRKNREEGHEQLYPMVEAVVQLRLEQ